MSEELVRTEGALAQQDDDDDGMSLSGFSMPQTNVTLPVIRQSYQDGIFNCKALGLRVIEEVIFQPFRGEPPRRNYEWDFDPDDVTPPTCYSLDGKVGSRLAEERTIYQYNSRKKTFTEKHGQVYGECGNCLFSLFGTGKHWNGDERQGKGIAGIACSQAYLMYGLWHLDDNTKLAAVIQVPPTSVKFVTTEGVEQGILQLQLREKKRFKPHELLWKILPQGNGPDRKAMQMLIDGYAKAEDIALARAERVRLDATITDMVRRFASGSSMEEETGGAQPDDAF